LPGLLLGMGFRASRIRALAVGATTGGFPLVWLPPEVVSFFVDIPFICFNQSAPWPLAPGRPLPCRSDVVRSRTPCQAVPAAALRCMLLLSANWQEPVARSSRQLAATNKCRQYIPTLGAAPTRHLHVGSRSIMSGSFCQLALRSDGSADVVQHCSGLLSVMRQKAWEAVEKVQQQYLSAI